MFLADENDGQDDSNLRSTLNASLAVVDNYPDLLTYQGGKTNRHDGAYAGITDIPVGGRSRGGDSGEMG